MPQSKEQLQLEFLATKIPEQITDEIDQDLFLIYFKSENKNLPLVTRNNDRSSILKLIEAKHPNFITSNFPVYKDDHIIKPFLKKWQDTMIKFPISEKDQQILKTPVLDKGNPHYKRTKFDVIYHYLWEIQFPLWLWNRFKEKADYNHLWLIFPDSEIAPSDNFAMEGIPRPNWEGKIQKGKDSPAKIKLENVEGKYVLLLNFGKENKGTINKYVMTPSYDFAPNPTLNNDGLRLPQDNARMESIRFTAESQEDFIGILLDEPVDFQQLPWLTTNKENPLIEWTTDHLIDLENYLEQQPNLQRFNKRFQVV